MSKVLAIVSCIILLFICFICTGSMALILLLSRSNTTSNQPIACPMDAKVCSNNVSVGRDPNNNCEFYDCPTTACTADVKICSDGTYVSRDPNNNCQFYSCN